jgi:hypothetical protein
MQILMFGVKISLWIITNLVTSKHFLEKKIVNDYIKHFLLVKFHQNVGKLENKK